MTLHLYYLSSALDYNTTEVQFHEPLQPHHGCFKNTLRRLTRGRNSYNSNAQTCVGFNYILQAQRRCFKRAQLQVTTRPRALLRRRLEQLLAQVNYLPAAERRPYLQVTTRPRALLRRWLEQLLTHGPLRLGQRISSESGSRNWAQLIGTLPR